MRKPERSLFRRLVLSGVGGVVSTPIFACILSAEISIYLKVFLIGLLIWNIGNALKRIDDRIC